MKRIFGRPFAPEVCPRPIPTGNAKTLATAPRDFRNPRRVCLVISAPCPSPAQQQHPRRPFALRSHEGPEPAAPLNGHTMARRNRCPKNCRPAVATQLLRPREPPGHESRRGGRMARMTESAGIRRHLARFGLEMSVVSADMGQYPLPSHPSDPTMEQGNTNAQDRISWNCDWRPS